MAYERVLFLYEAPVHIRFVDSIAMLNPLSRMQKTKNKSQDLTTVQVGITKSFLGEAATFIAKEEGFFKDHGLKVVFKHNSSGGISIKDLFRGKVDIAHVAETPVVYSLLDTSYTQETEVPPFQIFAEMMYGDELQHIIARKDRGIGKPTDIVRKKIALYLDTQLEYFFDSFLLEHQIPKNSLNIVNMNAASQTKAITNGNIDVAVTWEPYATYIQQQLGDRALKFDTQLTYSTLWLAVTLDNFAKQNPEVLVAYLRSIKEAQVYITKHPLKTQKLLAEQTNVSIEAVKATWGEIDYQLSLSERMLTLLEDQARWMRRNNNSDTLGYNFKNIVNFEPMRSVRPEGITVIQ